jgi:3',5'-cyclic AMP phosphodiesterase CpdA
MKSHNHQRLTSLLVLLILIAFYALIAKDPTQSVDYLSPAPVPDHIILSFSDDPTSTQSVTWRTDTTIHEAYAEIAPADASPNFVRTAKRLTAKTESFTLDQYHANYHAVTFTGLNPNSPYLYRVGSGKQWSEWFQFRTAAKQPQPFKFIYLGDGQERLLAHWSRAIRAAYSTAPDARFIIHGGDLVDHARAIQDWNEWFAAAGWINACIPIVPAIGNHEYYDGNWGRNVFTPLWRPQFTLPENGISELPETNYYFDFQGLRVIILNSNIEIEKQSEWLKRVLENNPNRWTVAVFHHPIYTGCNKNRDNKEIRNAWNPLFNQYQVDIVLTGHDHTYARGHSPEQKDLSSSARTGPVYIVSVSGPKLYQVNQNRWMDRAAENTQLYQIISIDNNILDYKAYTVIGEIYDAFQIKKNKKGRKTFVDLQPRNLPERTFKNTSPAPK